jgi:hypothetical protein
MSMEISNNFVRTLRNYVATALRAQGAAVLCDVSRGGVLVSSDICMTLCVAAVHWHVWFWHIALAHMCTDLCWLFLSLVCWLCRRLCFVVCCRSCLCADLCCHQAISAFDFSEALFGLAQASV